LLAHVREQRLDLGERVLVAAAHDGEVPGPALGGELDVHAHAGGEPIR
jgi:hypothetical protein